VSNAGSHTPRNGHRNAPRNGPVTVYPFPIPSTTKNVQRGAAPDLWEEPEKPDAPRLHEEPDGSRHRPGVFSNEEFRRLCVLVRAELKTQPTLAGADLMEQLKTACAAHHLRYDGAVLGRVLDLVQPRTRLVERHAEPPRTHWRDRCAHTPRCQRPTDCVLRAAKEGR
jgi:hypothetical protein